MIINDAELAVVQSQLTLAESALASLRRDVLPKNRNNYELLAEGYLEQIRRLRDEIDGYLEIPRGANTLSTEGDALPSNLADVTTGSR